MQVLISLFYSRCFILWMFLYVNVFRSSSVLLCLWKIKVEQFLFYVRIQIFYMYISCLELFFFLILRPGRKRGVRGGWSLHLSDEYWCCWQHRWFSDFLFSWNVFVMEVTGFVWFDIIFCVIIVDKNFWIIFYCSYKTFFPFSMHPQKLVPLQRLAPRQPCRRVLRLHRWTFHRLLLIPSVKVRSVFCLAL